MKIFGYEISKQQPQNLTQKTNRSVRKQIAYETSLIRVRQDIQRWRKSFTPAESKTNPNRTELLRCIKDAMLDAHITACIQQRKNAILCRDFNMTNGEEENKEQTDLFKVDWFYRFVDICLDIPGMGYSLIDFGPMIDDKFPELQLVPREYVCPEYQVVSQYQGGCDGVDYTDPKWSAWNMFVGDRFDLGFMSKACAHAIWKKSGIGNYSEFLSKAGIPMRIGKTSTTDDAQVTNMENALKNAGEAFWAVVDKDDVIEFLDSDKTGSSEIFIGMVELMNAELSKLILGQTSTTDEKSFVGSAKMHYNVRQDIIESDARMIENIVNGQLIPWLNKHHGYNITTVFKYNFAQSMTMQETGELLAKMMPNIKPDRQWLEKTFNFKLSEEETAPEETGAKKSGTSYENSTRSYSFVCKSCGGQAFNDVVNFADDLEEIILQSIWLGNTTPDKLPMNLYDEISNALIKALNEGYGTADGLSNTRLYEELKYSVRHFAAAKVFQQVSDIAALADTSSTYADFKAKASSVYQMYNTTWMQTEYNTGRSAARSASEYMTGILEKETLPMAEYQTVGDSRVRPEHAALDGIMEEVDHPFWDEYMPPNGWGCRCTRIRHASRTSTNLKGFKQPDDVPDLFLYNPAVDGTVFPPSHPYFQVKDKDFALDNFGLPI